MKSEFIQQSIEIVSDKTTLDVVKEITRQKENEDPFFVVDLADIVYKHKLWKLKMPRIHPFYAVKCNDTPVVLEFLAALGVNFDCASKIEIAAVLEAGVDPSRIIYANPCKTRSFIKYAASVGVDLMTFDNEIELHKIKTIHPQAKLVLRIRVDDSHSDFKLGLKFGADLAEVEELLQVALKLELSVVGVSFHVGSGCQDASSYPQAIADARHVFDLALGLGINMSLLDIGGGFPGRRDAKVSFEEMAFASSKAVDELFPEETGIQIIAEPGRYFVDSAFTICTNIIAKREHSRTGDGECMYYLNDGVYGSFNCVLYEPTSFHPIPILEEEESKRPLTKCSLWGPTCDSTDRIMEFCTLPRMEVGEWVVFENLGAYSLTSATTFNGFPKPAVKFVVPVHILFYLQQLPTWPQLLKSLHLHQQRIDQTLLRELPEVISV